MSTEPVDPDNPVYRKVATSVVRNFGTPDERTLFAIEADIGWTPPGATSSVISICRGMEEWAADWLLSLLAGQPVPYPADWGR